MYTYIFSPSTCIQKLCINLRSSNYSLLTFLCIETLFLLLPNWGYQVSFKNDLDFPPLNGVPIFKCNKINCVGMLELKKKSFYLMGTLIPSQSFVSFALGTQYLVTSVQNCNKYEKTSPQYSIFSTEVLRTNHNIVIFNTPLNPSGLPGGEPLALGQQGQLLTSGKYWDKLVYKGINMYIQISTCMYR